LSKFPNFFTYYARFSRSQSTRNLESCHHVAILAREMPPTLMAGKVIINTPEQKRKNNNKPSCYRLSPRSYFYIITMPRGRAADYTREELVHFLDIASSIKPTSQQH
jgi:hypothetical protein